MTHLNLIECFNMSADASPVRLDGATRREWTDDGVELVRDDFDGERSQCLFIRAQASSLGPFRLQLVGGYALRRCLGLGGWLLDPLSRTGAVFWSPRAPILRKLDALGRITAEMPVSPADFAMGSEAAAASFDIPEGYILDWALWRLDSRDDSSRLGWRDELMTAKTLESQAFFVYASHTSVQSAADFYQHLIHGKAYGACWAWPKQRKICDELDALSLHMVATGLSRSTGKRLYHLLRRQLVLSVLARQDLDGGFRHGEWTEQYESHNRLINGAVQLLASEHAESPEPALADALQRAATFIASQVDQTAVGAWFLHDSLEKSEEGMRHYPLGWARSDWLGKSPTNLLILNTHLDCMLALKRFEAVTGDASHAGLVASGVGALQAVLAARPAQWLFTPLLRIIELSLLPKAAQERLPFAKRALKRIGWKYVIPRWHLIRKRFPRLLMPDGYIERSLAQGDFVHRYHGVHLMDFERLISTIPAHSGTAELAAISDGLVDFGVRSQVTLHWKESAASKDSLAFWAEGLYRRCLRTGSETDRQLLATAVLDLSDAGLGLPPSLLGANGEIHPPAAAHATPSPVDPRLLVVNLTDRNGPSFMVINTAEAPLPLVFDRQEAMFAADARSPMQSVQIPARAWTMCTPAVAHPTQTTQASAAHSNATTL